MNKRQYKKLCKKAAQAMGLKNCGLEDGVYFVGIYCGGYDSEWDSEDAWPYIFSRFEGAVNTMVDNNSECGISWKPERLCVKPTAKNVLAWARASFN